MFNPNNYKDAEENARRGLINLAGPAASENNMPAPNYKIQGPIADHTQKPSAMQKAATTAGASVLGKAGEAALFGVPASASGTGAIGGMWPSIAKGAAMIPGWGWGLGALMAAKTLFNKGGSVGPLSPQYKEGGGPAWGEDPLFIEWTYLYDDLNSGIIEPDHPRLVELETILQEKYGGQTHVYKNEGGEIASLKEYLQELYARADAGEGWANDEIEATLIKIKELEAQGFKKGGKAKPMYAGEGMYTFPGVNWLPWYGGSLAELEDERMENRLYDADRPISRWEELGYHKMFPRYKGLYWNKGGDVQHKEHGGMTGPLSNNKSVKMEKKETIEYKN